ncbi:NrdH-redoxin [Candidatus Woesearchaeota archaeon]|nr:NrdH-redoxin [Candidatus Woesearchaeota archaeon]|tara:strand:- start:19451 stop:19687 length:237 start_codon:yes stop_codon:yes gene_type:complete
MKKAKIYTTKTCPWCVKTKEFFTENKVEYEEVDVGTDQKAAQEMFQKSGQMGVPVTDIGGEIIIGFDKNKLKKALSLS